MENGNNISERFYEIVDKIRFLTTIRIDFNNQSKVADTIETLEWLEREFYDLRKNCILNLGIAYDAELCGNAEIIDRMLEIFSESLQILRKSEGRIVHQFKASLKLCFRLCGFFMSYIYDYYNFFDNEIKWRNCLTSEIPETPEVSN